MQYKTLNLYRNSLISNNVLVVETLVKKVGKESRLKIKWMISFRYLLSLELVLVKLLDFYIVRDRNFPKVLNLHYLNFLLPYSDILLRFGVLFCAVYYENAYKMR